MHRRLLPARNDCARLTTWVRGRGVMGLVSVAALIAVVAVFPGGPTVPSGARSPRTGAPGHVSTGATMSTTVPGQAWAKRITGYLRAGDGNLLHFSVLLPRATGRFPVIMNYSGYDPGSIGGVAYQQGDTAMWPDLDSTLLHAGYAVLGVNMPGTGCSQGRFDLFSPRWGSDGADAVQWAAHQSWSTGNVGMDNWSYAGIGQLATAVDRPANLRAIAPGMVVTDPTRDVGYPGGVENTLFPDVWWLFIKTMWSYAATTARAEGDHLCLADVAAHLHQGAGASPPVVLRAHPYVDAYSASRSLLAHTSRIDVPVLSVEDWQDEATGVRGGYYQNTLDPARTWYVGTNGVHDFYVSTRYRQLLVRFFDRFVKGEHNGFDRGPHAWIWQDTTAPGAPIPDDTQLESASPGWVVPVSTLPVRVRPVALALRQGGALTSGPSTGTGSPDAYRYPVPGPQVNADLGVGETEWQGAPPSTTGSLAYTTAPLAHDVTLFGTASADLWVSSTSDDVDLQVTVTEVRSDGSEEYVQRGWLRVSQRQVDGSRSTALRPFHPQTRSSVRPLRPGTPVLARVEIDKFSHTFRAGSSIRIWIDSPSTTGEWGFADPTTPATIHVWHDPGHPSKVVLGVLSTARAPIAEPACGTLISEPCRPNPLAVPGGVPLRIP